MSLNSSTDVQTVCLLKGNCRGQEVGLLRVRNLNEADPRSLEVGLHELLSSRWSLVLHNKWTQEANELPAHQMPSQQQPFPHHQELSIPAGSYYLCPGSTAGEA